MSIEEALFALQTLLKRLKCAIGDSLEVPRKTGNGAIFTYESEGKVVFMRCGEALGNPEGESEGVSGTSVCACCEKEGSLLRGALDTDSESSSSTSSSCSGSSSQDSYSSSS